MNMFYTLRGNYNLVLTLCYGPNNSDEFKMVDLIII